MTALSQDVATELRARIVELEQQLQSGAADNARLQHELSLSRERQEASAEILSAVANTAGDDERALRQIAETSVRLFGATSVTLRVLGGDPWSRTIAVGPGAERIVSNVSSSQLKIGGKNFPGTVVAENRQIHFPDIFDVDARYADFPGLLHARAAGTRVMAGTPLRRDGKAIGTLILHRERAEPFSAEELALQQSFADQAVIAIDNARLFNESQQALARQTATADILRVISQSPTDVQPVFDAIVQTVVRLVGCETAFIQRCDGEHFWSVARCRREEGLMTVINPRHAPIDPGANFPSRAIVARATLHLPDWSQIELPEFERRIQEQLGYQSAVYLPLLRNGECIGVLGLAGSRPGMFSETDIALAEAFRDQALIAIENTRLFNETKEALERQTATADILRVIAGSPSDVRPVFDAIVNSAAELFEPHTVTITTLKDGAMHWGATASRGPGFDVARAMTVYPLPFDPDRSPSARAVAERRIIEIPDVDAPDTPEFTRRVAAAGGFRNATFVPLLHQGAGIGTIILTHPQAGFRLSEKQLALVQTFADQAVIAIENARLFNETREALERQTATADILKVIAGSPSDVQPVFAAIATSANRLIGGFSTAVFRFEAGIAYLAAFTPTNPAADEYLKSTFPRPVSDLDAFKQSQSGQTVQIADTETSPDPRIQNIGRVRGFRSMLFSPLMNKDESIGLISVTRTEPGRFADHHVQLLKTFADQAVIAIGNVALFKQVQARTRDLTEALQQQTATADVLKIISRSAFDIQAVFDTLTASAVDLLGMQSGTICVRDGEVFRFRSAAGAFWTEELWRYLQEHPAVPSRKTAAGRVVLSGRIEQIPDILDDPEYALPMRALTPEQTPRGMLGVPLLGKDGIEGAMVLSRQQPGPFTQREVDILQTFADQAVIAIENARLFDEVQAKTRDLTEALQRQTATADVLRIISRSIAHTAPVFDAILDSCQRLFNPYDTAVYLVEGDYVRGVARRGPGAGDWGADSMPLEGSSTGLAIAQRRAVHYPDLADKPKLPEDKRAIVRDTGGMTVLYAPMISQNSGIGSLVVTRRPKNPFTDAEIALIQTFADQAVIAIENARLFEEVQAKTRDLTEALERQTATSEVLSVISRSPSDLQPVLEAISETAARLVGSEQTMFFRFDGEVFRILASWNFPPEVHEMLERRPLKPGHPSAIGRAGASLKPVCIPDVLQDPHYGLTSEQNRARYRTTLGVPLLREGRLIGAFSLNRSEPNSFTNKHIELVSMFADQAVIAIENTRLFDEVQAKTRELTEALQQQTATADVLKVISRSAFDLQTVFNTLLESAAKLIGASNGALCVREDKLFRYRATLASDPEWTTYLQTHPARAGRHSISGRVILSGEVETIADVRKDPEYDQSYWLEGHTSMIGVPLLRSGQVEGVFSLARPYAGGFKPREIELVRTFADQAQIAIENTRLFDQVQQRTRELTQSLEDLRAAQDRLVQTEKLASLGQLTAGIAHEIKNPLNFVNNFAALSSELTDELNDVLAQASLTETIRDEVEELTGLLKDNLQKIVQHGKRADSIVKNMLLHSREGSGEHRPTDVNALVEESLNLAYHGARAEKPQFNVTLKRELDPAAGMAELFPQEITRVLLNLITNGFYAVTKRGSENGAGFEPVLSAATRDRGAHIEIRIRDNGTGIPPDVKEKMFNPFFTTKPAGEGTGLGLSMSHDIIVKQHGGTIDVATAPGEFTEFTILLPRNSSFSDKNRG